MKKTTKKITKRKARDYDLVYAAELARCYWSGEPFQVKRDGRVIGEFHVDGDALAKTLEGFAERGTFEVRIERLLPASERRKYIQWNFNRLRELGCTPGQAINIILETDDVKEQTVLDALYRTKTRNT